MKNIVSIPLLKENLKRFWGLGAITFCSYFLFTNFVLLLGDGHYDFYTVELMLGTNHPAYIFFDILFPVISAVTVFSYLTKVNSVTLMHSMPFSRKSLFVTNYLSGLILCTIPVLLNSIVMIILKQPISAPAWYETLYGPNIFTTAAILKVFVSNFVIILFTYSISVLAGFVSANSVIHLLTAFAMNFICPCLYLTTIGWSYCFLYGCSEPDYIWNIILKMHPALCVIQYDRGTNLGAVEMIIFTVIAIIISVLGFVFYKKRALEKTGDSYVFNFIKYIISFIFTYIPATLMAIIMSEISGGSMTFGIIIGGFIGFLIGWMIINKSFRIFNLKSLKVMLGCFAATALVISIFLFDLTGFEKRIPNEKDIIGVSYNCNYIGNGFVPETITDKENIENLRKVHKQLIDCKNNKVDVNETTWFNITYVLKNGSTVKRDYGNIPVSVLESSNELRKLYESTEVSKSAEELLTFKPDESLIVINPILNEYLLDGGLTLDANDSAALEFKTEIINALVLDLKERTFEEATSHKMPYGDISISMEVPKYDVPLKDMHYLSYTDSMSIDGRENYIISTSINFNSDYENLVNVLEKHGILDGIIPSEKDGFIVIQKDTDNRERDYCIFYEDETVLKETIKKNANKNGDIVIFDSELQKEVIKQAALSNYAFSKVPDANRMWMTIYGYSFEYLDEGVKKHNGYISSMYSTWVDSRNLPSLN